MKKIAVIAMLLVLGLCAVASAEENPKLGIDLGLDYNSFYNFRGGPDFIDRPFNGAFLPWAGYAAGEFYFTVCGEIAPGLLGVSGSFSNNSGTPVLSEGASKEEKAWTGVDFGVTWSKSLADESVALGAEVWFYWYPGSKDQYGFTASYFTGTLSIQLPKVPLAPKLKVIQAFTPDDANGTREKFKDLYFNLSIGHNIELVKDIANLDLNLGAGYWRYGTYIGYEKNGFSDFIASAKYTINLASSLKLWSQFNMGLVPQNDFAYGTKGGDLRFWVNCGIGYTL